MFIRKYRFGGGGAPDFPAKYGLRAFSTKTSKPTHCGTFCEACRKTRGRESAEALPGRHSNRPAPLSHAASPLKNPGGISPRNGIGRTRLRQRAGKNLSPDSLGRQPEAQARFRIGMNARTRDVYSSTTGPNFSRIF